MDSLLSLLARCPLLSGLVFAAAPLTTTPPSVSAENAAAAASSPAALDWRMQLFLSALAVFCALLYFRFFVKAATGHGRVRAERFGLPEAVVAVFLSSLLLLLIGHGLRAALAVTNGSAPVPPTPSSQDIVAAVLGTFVVQILLVGGLLVGLAARHIPIAETLGMASPGTMYPPPLRWPANPIKPPPTLGRALWCALGLVIAAYPLLLGAAALAQRIPGMPVPKPGQEEEAVRLFKASASLEPKIAMILAAVVIAPLVEEFVFRGYLYPVFRRYLGVTAGVILNAGLFAAMHLHLPSLAPLFVLAVCLTLAYEATGSLLVPMAMHAMFNAFNVGLMIFGVAGG